MIFKDIKIIDEQFRAVPHMYVETEGEFIKYVGAEAPDMTGKEVYDGRNKVLMPAFYNTHCHVPMTLLRGYGEGLPLQEWLNTRIFPFEACFKAEEKYWGAKLGAIELIKSGCVSITDMYFDLADYGKALYEAGMKANLSNGVVCFDDSASYFDDNAYKDTVRLMEWLEDKKDGRIKPEASIHSEYASREKICRETIEWAAEQGLGITVHVSETESEHAECIIRHGETPVGYFNRLGLFKQRATLAHCTYISDEDMDILRKNGAFVAHNPSSNCKLGSGIARIKEMFDKGISVTIATDGASSNNNLNMMEDMHLAAMLVRGANRDAGAISAASILKMATRLGALAQGRRDCGLIKEGMRADMIVIDLDTENMVPDFDTVSNIVFSAGSENIIMTMCDGQVIMKDRKLTLIDEAETRAKAAESFESVDKRVNL